MFDIIKGVNIGQGEGNAFGGGIYGASCEIGFSNGPTKVTLNVVSENGIYQSISPNVYSTPYNINLNGKVFSGMYLYAYEKNKSAGSALLTLNFIDSSLVLDKIFIGLLHRHGNQNVETRLQTGVFTVRCPSCANGNITGMSGEVRRYLDVIPGGQYIQKNGDGGGFVILGKEYFPESACDIPTVDYNFTELCQAMTAFGIKHELSIYDLNPLYRQEYAGGTLREILNNWASDFSFEFYFDGDVLKAIDLRRPINVDEIIDFAEENEYVTSTTYGETLENTYTQSVVARYLKPSTPIEYNNTFHFKQITTPITLNDVLADGTCAGRSGETLLTCIALSKFDPALREIYLANKALDTNNWAMLDALGFKYYPSDNIPSEVIEDAKATVILNSSFCTNNQDKTLTACNPDNFVVLIGLFREDIKEKVEQWDEDAANFLGQYYYFNTELPFNNFWCPYSSDWFIYYTSHSQWTSVPNSQTYGGNALPFAAILQDPSSSVPHLVNLRPKSIFTCDDNSWGIDETTYKAAKANSDYDAFKPQIMLFTDLPVPAQIALSSIQQAAMNITDMSSSTVSALQRDIFANGAVAAFYIVPKFDKIPNGPRISPIAGRMINPLVFSRVTTRTSADETAARCTTYCDTNIVSEICNCGAQYTPIPYFASFLAPYFQVAHPNGFVSNIVFPVDSTYFGYFSHSRYYKTTNPPVKKIYGNPPSSANNTLGVRVVDYDITPDIDAVMDNNDAVNLYIYSPTNNQIMTAQAYYDELANLNNLTVLPQKRVTMTLSKTDVALLGLPISPANGLIGMSLSLSDGGVETQLEFATRPPVIPKPEAVFSKIKFRLKE